MKRTPENLRALVAVIRADLSAIDRIERELGKIVPPDATVDSLVDFTPRSASAYALHNIYNALENSFEQISRTFENHVVDTTKWHAELLGKMFLEIPDVRPALFSPDLRVALDDLRGFRHIFRHSYDFQLDAEKTLHAIKHWRASSARVVSALGRFSDWALAMAQSDS